MTSESFELTTEMSNDLTYYSDRWNPRRMKLFIEKLEKLKELLIIEYGYTREEWELLAIDEVEND